LTRLDGNLISALEMVQLLIPKQPKSILNQMSPAGFPHGPAGLI
jgi:hypothetical protein